MFANSRLMLFVELQIFLLKTNEVEIIFFRDGLHSVAIRAVLHFVPMIARQALNIKSCVIVSTKRCKI